MGFGAHQRALMAAFSTPAERDDFIISHDLHNVDVDVRQCGAIRGNESTHALPALRTCGFVAVDPVFREDLAHDAFIVVPIPTLFDPATHEFTVLASPYGPPPSQMV